MTIRFRVVFFTTAMSFSGVFGMVAPSWAHCTTPVPQTLAFPYLAFVRPLPPESKTAAARARNHAPQAAILKTELNSFNLDDPGRDATRNVEHGDYRFLAVRGFLNAFDGLGVEPGAIYDAYGIRIIEGAQGNKRVAEYRHLVEMAAQYTKTYNIALKQWLQSKGLWFNRVDKMQTLWAPPHDSFRFRAYDPPHGYIPDADTAIRIAKAIWKPIYGENADSKSPFIAKERDGIWYVRGTLPKGTIGGVPYAVIRACSGEILGVTATQ